MGLTISDSDLLVIRVEDGAPVDHPLTYSNFRMLFPEVSFPPTPVEDLVRPYGYAVFKYTERPKPVKFETTTDGPIEWDDTLGAFTNRWVQVPFTPEQMEAATKQQWATLYRVRNDKLAASDWTQLPDVLLTAEQVTAWREYRQALRDWPDTVTDPWNPPPFPKPPAA